MNYYRVSAVLLLFLISFPLRGQESPPTDTRPVQVSLKIEREEDNEDETLRDVIAKAVLLELEISGFKVVNMSDREGDTRWADYLIEGSYQEKDNKLDIELRLYRKGSKAVIASAALLDQELSLFLAKAIQKAVADHLVTVMTSRVIAEKQEQNTVEKPFVDDSYPPRWRVDTGIAAYIPMDTMGRVYLDMGFQARLLAGYTLFLGNVDLVLGLGTGVIFLKETALQENPNSFTGIPLAAVASLYFPGPAASPYLRLGSGAVFWNSQSSQALEVKFYFEGALGTAFTFSRAFGLVVDFAVQGPSPLAFSPGLFLTFRF